MSAHEAVHGTGMVHGRFQPFHLGHLEYVQMAARRCQQLYVGITNPDPTHVRTETTDPHRSAPEANPYPYHLRYRMVREALGDAGIEPAAIVPFPIHEPALWPHYVPAGTVHLIRLHSAWGAEKHRRLQAAGFAVEVLPAPAGKTISGEQVRKRRAAGESWTELVPVPVARVLQATG